MAPFAIPPGKKAAVVALRAQLRRKIAKQERELAAPDLIRYRELIRTVYLDIRDGLRRPPTLQNTDGDPFVLHTLTFEIGSPQVAFDALASLAWGESKEDLLNDAELAADGALLSIVFEWRKKRQHSAQDLGQHNLGAPENHGTYTHGRSKLCPAGQKNS